MKYGLDLVIPISRKRFTAFTCSSFMNNPVIIDIVLIKNITDYAIITAR